MVPLSVTLELSEVFEVVLLAVVWFVLSDEFVTLPVVAFYYSTVVTLPALCVSFTDGVLALFVMLTPSV